MSGIRPCFSSYLEFGKELLSSIKAYLLIFVFVGVIFFGAMHSSDYF